MKRILKKSLRQQKRSLENLAAAMSELNNNVEIKLQQKQYLQNLMVTNQRLLNSNNVNNLLLF